MDETIDDDSGIPFLQNGDDIPVHSTPIKGERVPLPSTKNVSKFLQHKTRRRIVETDSESIQSVRPSDYLTDTKGRSARGYGTDYKYELKPVTLDIQKQPHPQPDKTLDISNQDNLRPKMRDFSHRLDSVSQENFDQKYFSSRPGTYSSTVSQSNSQYNKEQASPNSQSISILQTSLANENHNAFSSYRSYLNKDNKLHATENDGISYRIHTHISSVSKTSCNSVTDDKELTPNKDKSSGQFEANYKAGENNRDDTVTDRVRFTFDSSKYSNRYSQQNSSLTDLENATITKQRQEVQLLVSELKDRDRELSDMMSSHQQQLIAWEQDRLRLISLEKKSHQLEEDLQTKSSQLRNAVLTLKAVKVRESDNKAELEKFRSAIDKLGTERSNAVEEAEKYKTENIELHNQVESLSIRAGQLQARETELTTNIKAKEKDLSYATQQMKDLSTRLQQLDLRCKECQDREREALKDKEQWKDRYENSQLELQKLTEELHMKRSQCSRILEENRSARHQLSLLQKEAGERERCKDDIIESMRVKQERTDTQLKNIRELYERQLKEVSQLQMQLDTSKDIIHQQQSSMDQLQFSQSDRSSELTPERSRAKQRLTFSPHNRLPTNHKFREPDSSHTQSSGYQSQLSDNQTGIVSQTGSVGATNDIKNYQTNPQTVINSDNLMTDENQTNLNFPRTGSLFQSEESNQSPRTTCIEYIWQKSVESNTENKTYSFDEKSENNSRTSTDYRSSPGRNNLRTNSQSPIRQSKTSSSMESSPSGKQKVVIKQTTIELLPQESPEFDETNPSEHAYSDGRNTKVNGAEPEGRTDVNTSGAEGGLEKEYVFENKLRSFLDDLDTDFDDSIWDDKPDRTQSISTVDCSPSSKLQKLLLESRLMIDSLGKSTDMPLQTSTMANDTLEKPNFDDTNSGDTR